MYLTHCWYSKKYYPSGSGASVGGMGSKLDEQTFPSEFESHCVPQFIRLSVAMAQVESYQNSKKNDTSLLNTQHYKVMYRGYTRTIEGKELRPPLHLGVIILPTPQLGQDRTQDQFFKRSLTGLNSEFSFS